MTLLCVELSLPKSSFMAVLYDLLRRAVFKQLGTKSALRRKDTSQHSVVSRWAQNRLLEVYRGPRLTNIFSEPLQQWDIESLCTSDCSSPWRAIYATTGRGDICPELEHRDNILRKVDYNYKIPAIFSDCSKIHPDGLHHQVPLIVHR